MEFQIRELGCVPWCCRLLVLWGWADAVWIVCSSIIVVLSTEMRHHFTTSRGVAWSNDNRLMLTITCRSRPSSLSYRVCIVMILACLRRVVDGLVSPIARIESTLRALVIWRSLLLCSWTSAAVSKMGRDWLNCRVIEPWHLFATLVSIMLTTSNNRFHHQVVCLDDGGVHNCAKLLIVPHRHLTSSKSSIVVSLMLLTVKLTRLGRVWSFSHVHVNSPPRVCLVLSIYWLIDLLWATAVIWVCALLSLLHHFVRSNSCICSAYSMLVSSMASNHRILWILRRSMRACISLKRVMSRAIAVCNRHVHPVLDILLSLLWELRLVSHMLTISLAKSSSHSHYLSLMAAWIAMTAFVHTITIVIMLCAINCCFSHCWRWNFSRVISSTAHSSSLLVWSSVILRCVGDAWVIGLHSIIAITVTTWMRYCLKLRSIMDSSNFNWRSDCHSCHFTMSRLPLSTRIFSISSTVAHSWVGTTLRLTIDCPKMRWNLLLRILLTCTTFLRTWPSRSLWYSIASVPSWLAIRSYVLLHFRIILVFWTELVDFCLKL